MKATTTGLIAGLLFTIAIVTGGWLGFLLAVIFGTVGLAIGAQLDGTIDVRSVFGSKRG